MDNNIVNERIFKFRELMKNAGIDAVIVPQTDPHMSEYIAEHYQVRRWLSGFTGSAGALVITGDKAYVWADSRYWLQADNQLKDTCIEVMKEGMPDTPAIAEWLSDNLKRGAVVGIDGMLFSKVAADNLRQTLEKKGIELNTNFDIIPKLWTDRPALPEGEVFIHDEKYAGESASSKIQRTLEDVRKKGGNAIFISDLAEIAWMLNIRSTDVRCNPVAISYLYIDEDGATLFIDPKKIQENVAEYLNHSANTKIEPYSSVKNFLTALSDSVKVVVSPAQTPVALVEALGKHAITVDSSVAMFKGCKNPVQIEGIRKAMIRDGVALVKAFMEIENTVSSKNSGEDDKVETVTLTEMDVAEILTRHRKEQDLYFEDSFDTIAGFGPHGAIVHYSASPKTNVNISDDNLLLIDSGASYLDGTTDITRTVYLGKSPSSEMCKDFTLVLKGHIALAMAVFPEGTTGIQLDILARLPLWKDGKTYLHGTGHGVGQFLNVHEGPQRITYNANTVPLRPGMVTSDEPGVYLSGRYGIRCENLILTKEAFTTEFGKFMKFETLTLFPFDTRLIDYDMLSEDEYQWLCNYHQYVYQKLSPYLTETERAWLQEKTGQGYGNYDSYADFNCDEIPF